MSRININCTSLISEITVGNVVNLNILLEIRGDFLTLWRQLFVRSKCFHFFVSLSSEMIEISHSHIIVRARKRGNIHKHTQQISAH